MATLLLEDGTKLNAKSFGAQGETVGQIVFNTTCGGYQEIITDPSYAGQIIVFTYPEIGNCGINNEDFQSLNSGLKGIVVKEYSKNYSHYKSAYSLKDYLIERNIIALENVDTRLLTHKIRDFGTMNCLISSKDLDENEIEEKLKTLKNFEIDPNIVSKVTTKENYTKGEGNPIKVAALDFGVKYSIVKTLSEACQVDVFKAQTDAQTILNGNYDALLLLNGAGDPTNCKEQIETVKNLVGKLPIFGIGIGTQILALSIGAKTYRLKYGHHGTNHPIMDLKTGKISMYCQNHLHAVESESLKGIAQITHKNLNDETVEGFECEELKIHAIQFHPECGIKEGDLGETLGKWVELIKKYKKLKV